jgi:glutathione S-transferase
MLKIWGRPNSINVQKVLWCAAELGLEFERTDLGGQFGGTDTPDYRAMNPMGLIPTIDDDGFILWESHSCVRYLAAKHDAGGLWPTDVAVRAEAEKWMDWILSAVNQPLGVVFWGLIRTPEAERDMAAIDAAKDVMNGLWGIADKRLAGRDFLASERITIGDLVLGPYAYRWAGLFGDEALLPNVKAWYERLAARDGFRQHIMQPLS